MRRTLSVLLVLAFAIMLPRSDAQVLTNEHIRRMTSAGLPPAVIVAKITSSETNFDTSVDALILLA